MLWMVQDNHTSPCVFTKRWKNIEQPCVHAVRTETVFTVDSKVFLRIQEWSEPKHTGCVHSHLASNLYKQTHTIHTIHSNEKQEKYLGKKSHIPEKFWLRTTFDLLSLELKSSLLNCHLSNPANLIFGGCHALQFCVFSWLNLTLTKIHIHTTYSLHYKFLSFVWQMKWQFCAA